MRRSCLALLLLSAANGARAEDGVPAMRHFSEQEISAIAMPQLAFNESPADVQDYEKYYYFHRDGTSFDEAYADIRECDALSSGLSFRQPDTFGANSYYAMQYGVGGVIGGAIGSALSEAIFGSAERRKERRMNMRNCMFYKEYTRYGLKKGMWVKFNFEEGNAKVEGDEREHYLLQQARVASGPKPEQGAIEP